MPITKDGNNIVQYTQADNKFRSEDTHVFPDNGFAVADSVDPLKQIQFDAGAQNTNVTHTIAAPANTAAVTTTLPSVSGVLSTGAASSGAGTAAGTGVTASEAGNDVIHQTTLTLASASVPITSTSTNNGFGGLKIYDLPEGHVRILGCVAELTDISVPVADQADYTDGTPEGDVGIGTVIIANADTFGTDATDDDLSTGAAFTMTDYAATANCAPEAAQSLDGTSTAKDVNLNVLIDAADIDDDVATTVEVSGTVTITWINLGDY